MHSVSNHSVVQVVQARQFMADVCQDEYTVLDAISHVNQQLAASVAEDQALRFIMIRIYIIIPQLSICV